jgi:hypothetical protein
VIGALLCFLGFHGPDWFGWGGHRRASRTAPFERTCECCGAVWRGTEVNTRNYRILGGWERVK